MSLSSLSGKNIITYDELSALLDELKDNLENSEDDKENEVLEKEIEETENVMECMCYSEELILDDYFKTLAIEQAEDLNGVDMNQWPFYCIDWEQAADELKQDYTCVDFDGYTYYTRA